MTTDDHTHLLEEFAARGTEVSAAGVQVFAIAVKTRQDSAAKQIEADSLLASAEPSGAGRVVPGVLAMWWIRAWTCDNSKSHHSRNHMRMKGVVVRVDGVDKRITLGQMDRLTSKAKSWKAIVCRGTGGALYRLCDAVSNAALRCERSAGPPRPLPPPPTAQHVAVVAPRPADPVPETEPIDTDAWLRDNAATRAAPVVPSESVPAVQVHAWPVDACPHDARIQQLEQLVGSLAGVVAGLQTNMAKVVTVLEHDNDACREPMAAAARDADDIEALRAQIRRLDADVRDRDSTISRLARLLEDKADECTRLRSIETKRASGEPPRGRGSRSRRARRDDDDDCSNDASDDASDAARHLKRGAWGWPNASSAPPRKRKRCRAIDAPQRSAVQMVVLS